MQRIIRRDVRDVFESVEKKRAFPDLPRPGDQYGGENRKRSVDRRFYMPCDILDPPRVSVDPECNSVITENIGLSRGIRIRQLHIVTNNVEDGNTGKTGRVISLNYELQTGFQYV